MAKVWIGISNVRISVFKVAVHITLCCSLISECKSWNIVCVTVLWWITMEGMHSYSATPQQHIQYRATICHKHMISCSACIWRSKYIINVRKVNSNVRLLSQSQRLKLVEWEVASWRSCKSHTYDVASFCCSELFFEQQSPVGFQEDNTQRNECYESVRRRFEDELLGQKCNKHQNWPFLWIFWGSDLVSIVNDDNEFLQNDSTKSLFWLWFWWFEGQNAISPIIGPWGFTSRL